MQISKHAYPAIDVVAQAQAQQRHKLKSIAINISIARKLVEFFLIVHVEDIFAEVYYLDILILRYKFEKIDSAFSRDLLLRMCEREGTVNLTFKQCIF